MNLYESIKKNQLKEEESFKNTATNIDHYIRHYEYQPEIEPEDIFRKSSDSYYFTIVKNENEAEKFNYHSDYWGSEDEYQDQNVELVSSLEHYIESGDPMYFEDEDSTKHYFKVTGVAIDKQYNSISHTKILIEELENTNESNLKEATDDKEWEAICKEFCKKIGAELLFVNDDNFGYSDKDGHMVHMYADELERYLKTHDIYQKEKELSDEDAEVVADTLKDYKKFKKIDESNSLSFDDMVIDSYKHITEELGKEATIEDIFDDIIHNYNQDYISDETLKDTNQAFDDIKYVLRHKNLKYLEEAENIGSKKFFITKFDDNSDRNGEEVEITDYKDNGRLDIKFIKDGKDLKDVYDTEVYSVSYRINNDGSVSLIGKDLGEYKDKIINYIKGKE